MTHIVLETDRLTKRFGGWRPPMNAVWKWSPGRFMP
jgi:hypothetical protein